MLQSLALQLLAFLEQRQQPDPHSMSLLEVYRSSLLMSLRGWVERGFPLSSPLGLLFMLAGISQILLGSLFLLLAALQEGYDKGILQHMVMDPSLVLERPLTTAGLLFLMLGYGLYLLHPRLGALSARILSRLL